MQRHAYLVNLSRGNLVDEAALEAALNEKRIAGAALDVGRAPDQMPSPHLAKRPDVVATPHIGGLTPPAIEGQALETVVQVGEIVHGRAPEGSVNADRAAAPAPVRRSTITIDLCARRYKVGQQTTLCEERTMQWPLPTQETETGGAARGVRHAHPFLRRQVSQAPGRTDPGTRCHGR